MTSHILRLGIAGAVLFSLAACGGSSGGSGNIDPNNQAPVISGFNPASPLSIQVRQQNVMVSVLASDPENDPLTFAWQQVSGPVVLLRNTTSETVTFNGPPEDGAGETIVLRVRVSDPNQETSATVTINVAELEFNSPPVVEAGPDQSVNAGEPVVLTATASDPDEGDTLSFGWTQIDGEPVVSLSNANALTAGFTAPNVTERRVLTFRITVTDSADPPNQASDQTVVTIQPLPRPAGPTNLYVSLNGADNQNTIQKYVESTPASLDYSLERSFTSIDNQGIALDIMGNAVHIGDDDQDQPGDITGGISYLCKLGSRANGAEFSDGDRDRDIRGVTNAPLPGSSNNSGLGRPGAKGVTIAHRRGYLIVANHAGRNIKVFGGSTEGDQAAVATIPLSARPWDVAYDEERDILYAAATNGTVRILDNFLDSIEAGASNEETRLFALVSAAGERLGSNLHGIAYEPVGDRLVITDVGPETAAADPPNGFDSDGSLYLLSNVSALNGDVVPDMVRRGPNTGLGNPVDVIVNGRDAIIAEKANDKILIVRNVFTAAGGNVAPDAMLDVIKPESVAIELLNQPSRPAVTDLVDDSVTLNSLLVTISNGNLPRVIGLDPALGEQDNPTGFVIPGGGSETQGLVLDARGNGYILVERPGGMTSPSLGTIYAIDRLATERLRAPFADNPGEFEASRDREFEDAGGSSISPLLQMPRYVDIDQKQGLLYVTDAASSAFPQQLTIEVYSLCGTGDALATVVVDTMDNSNVAPPTNLHFDPGSGDLYVSMQNGRFAVFRNFDVRFQDNPQPQVVQPQRVGDLGISEPAATGALGGIRYVANRDALIFTDIGAEGNETDGKIFIIQGASSLGSGELVNTIIEGSAAQLGDPVDIAYDGANLYVLDEARRSVHRFNNIFSKSSGAVPPDATTLLGEFGGDPRGLVLAPDYLADIPRQAD